MRQYQQQEQGGSDRHRSPPQQPRCRDRRRASARGYGEGEHGEACGALRGEILAGAGSSSACRRSPYQRRGVRS